MVCTAKNTLISPNFLVWKFCVKKQFPHSFGLPKIFCSVIDTLVESAFFIQLSEDQLHLPSQPDIIHTFSGYLELMACRVSGKFIERIDCQKMKLIP